jgi:hypothetical protein
LQQIVFQISGMEQNNRNWSLTVEEGLSRHQLHPESSAEMKRAVVQQAAEEEHQPTYLFFQVLNFRSPEGTPTSVVYNMF